MRRFVVALVVAFGLAISFIPASTHASSLSIQPALVTSKMSVGEKQKGYVDVVNPSSQKIVVGFSVQAFRQTNNAGELEFYDSPIISRAIQLDITQVELGSHEAVRLYYLVDGSLLPEGDVTAGIFASIQPNRVLAATQTARVGTLLVLQHGNKPKPYLAVNNFSAPALQFGGAIKLDFSVKNETPPASAVFPSIAIDMAPYGRQIVTGPLIMSGVERSITYNKSGNYFGPIRITIQAGDSKSTRWVFAVTGFWQWLAPLVTIAICAFVIHRRLRSKK